jgi:hypothetical protein
MLSTLSKAASKVNKKSIELIRMHLAKRVENSNKLVGIILKLNKPETGLTLTKRKFFMMIKQVIKKIYPKITMTNELLVDVWDQACGMEFSQDKNENDVIEKDTLDNWLFYCE